MTNRHTDSPAGRSADPRTPANDDVQRLERQKDSHPPSPPSPPITTPRWGRGRGRGGGGGGGRPPARGGGGGGGGRGALTPYSGAQCNAARPLAGRAAPSTTRYGKGQAGLQAARAASSPGGQTPC